MKSFKKTNIQYIRALKSIPLASQTFSKSSMNFVNGANPLFLDKGEGCYVWDIDGNKFIDYVLGLLPIILGYKDSDINNAIKAQLEKGITFSLATNLEAELAEKLIKLIPCAEMVRFGKNGSDVTTAAVRLARAYTNRNVIVTCGYHGWHDWYIGTTSRNLGVPEIVQNLSIKIPYGNIDKSKEIILKNKAEIAAVIVEPSGNRNIDIKFLTMLKDITKKLNIVLVFDEVVTGFRMNIGGAQNEYNILPDLSCFGKAMGNGMPISAIVGKKKIMEFMEKIFFSGTFGGECLSLAAAIATIDKVQQTKTIEQIHKLGAKLKLEINNILNQKNINEYIKIVGPDWKPSIEISNLKDTPTTSLLRQELANFGILSTNTIGLCLEHCNKNILDMTLDAWNSASKNIETALKSKNPKKFLRGKPIQSIFKVR